MLEHFHFLEPLWLLAILPLMLIFWFAFQAKTDSKSWEKVVDAKLLPLLLKGEDKNTKQPLKFLLASAWIISVIALADPVWEKVPRPIFQTNAARVLVLDLSNSMLINDLKPTRLARARFKIEDILSREEEGQTGLVLFAGEAFTASPLTRDTETIRSLLKVLTPQIMPAQGSRADLGLAKAHELLKQSGIASGEVLLIADGVSQKSLGLNEATRLRQAGHKVSVLAVGTAAGGTLNFRNNTTVTVKLETAPLSEIAKNGGGNYHLISNNNSDLNHLLTQTSDKNTINDNQESANENEDVQNSEWKSTGPLLILLLLPIAALAFRRGWLLNIAVAMITLSMLSLPQESYANEDSAVTNAQEQQESKWRNFVELVSKNKSQRIDNAFKNKRYQKALDLSDEPLSKGNAEYKLENYEAALESFKQAEGSTARYNEGNTLAKLEKYEDAIAAYDEALKLDSHMQDAIDNKKAIEDFLKQQQQNQQASNENQQNESDSQNKDQDQQNSDSQQSKDGKEGSETSENKDQEGKENEKENQFSDANKELENKKDKEESQSTEGKSNETKDEEKQDAEEQLADDPDSNNQDSEENLTSLESKELADELSEEEKMAAEQWLRRIPDDPGGLLRRKFRHQYNQYRKRPASTEDPW